MNKAKFFTCKNNQLMFRGLIVISTNVFMKVRKTLFDKARDLLIKKPIGNGKYI